MCLTKNHVLPKIRSAQKIQQVQEGQPLQQNKIRPITVCRVAYFFIFPKLGKTLNVKGNNMCIEI